MCNKCRIEEVVQSVSHAPSLCSLIEPHAWKRWEPWLNASNIGWCWGGRINQILQCTGFVFCNKYSMLVVNWAIPGVGRSNLCWLVELGWYKSVSKGWVYELLKVCISECRINKLWWHLKALDLLQGLEEPKQRNRPLLSSLCVIQTCTHLYSSNCYPQRRMNWNHSQSFLIENRFHVNTPHSHS